MAAGAIAVEVKPLAAALGQAVVGNRANGLVAIQQLALGVLEGGEQVENRLGPVDRLLQGRQRCCGQGRKGWGLIGIAEGTGIAGTFEGLGEAWAREIGCAGHPHESVAVPDPHGDGTALGPFHLLGLAPIHLNRCIGAAGRAQIPLVDPRAAGKLLEVIPELDGVEAFGVGAHLGAGLGVHG